MTTIVKATVIIILLLLIVIITISIITIIIIIIYRSINPMNLSCLLGEVLLVSLGTNCLRVVEEEEEVDRYRDTW
jgi:hypothetical protein